MKVKKNIHIEGIKDLLISIIGCAILSLYMYAVIQLTF